ncbi:Mpo1-like protein [Streptomyces sp. CBG33]|uniref:Mpo1-like protein n=1 Tax=Streptomyces sp. CBG33 TaxID=2762624 RepID=UPI00365EE8AE
MRSRRGAARTWSCLTPFCGVRLVRHSLYAGWPAHFLIEKNNPATFGHPAWSLRGDAQMIRMMLAGRDHELAETARKWLAENR